LLAAVTVMVYAAGFDGNFVYEDTRTQVGGFGQTISVLGEWRGVRGLWRPRGLTDATYSATTAWAGASSRAAKAVNLGVHLLNGALLWLLAQRVVSAPAAVFALGLFWLLPVQSEPVTGIAYRSELIVGFWLLLALVAAERGWLPVAWLCAALAVTGKDAGIVALALVPAWLSWRRSSAWTRAAKTWWAVACVTPVLYGLLTLQRFDALHVQPPEGMARQLAALGGLMRVAIWPDALTVDPDWTHLSGWVALLAVQAWVALLAWAYLRRWPLWGFALAWTLIAFLPRIVLQLGDGPYERYLYTPLLAWCLAAGAALYPKESV